MELLNSIAGVTVVREIEGRAVDPALGKLVLCGRSRNGWRL